ncbi:MAG: hypothetical protein Q4G08_09215 [Capnocytophaga sp.]|nr:hypothetical protein [Capnocytophaga sp.]
MKNKIIWIIGTFLYALCMTLFFVYKGYSYGVNDDLMTAFGFLSIFVVANFIAFMLFKRKKESKPYIYPVFGIFLALLLCIGGFATDRNLLFYASMVVGSVSILLFIINRKSVVN